MAGAYGEGLKNKSLYVFEEDWQLLKEVASYHATKLSDWIVQQAKAESARIDAIRTAPKTVTE